MVTFGVLFKTLEFISLSDLAIKFSSSLKKVNSDLVKMLKACVVVFLTD